MNIHAPMMKNLFTHTTSKSPILKNIIILILKIFSAPYLGKREVRRCIDFVDDVRFMKESFGDVTNQKE